MYVCPMDVAISALRAELSSWIERARAGEDVVITDRGTPVVRLVAVGGASVLEDLVARGVIGKPTRAERPSARDLVRVRARGPVADLVGEQRR